jgi:uncharacterized protein involved in exopolysaccharide biosynthesis
MNGNTADEINLMDYIQVIRKRKWLIILGTLICMCAAAVVSFLIPKVYEAKAYLMAFFMEYLEKNKSNLEKPV